MREQPSSVSLFFPVYKDEPTVRVVAEKSLRLLRPFGIPFEVIIVDDGSPDRAGEIADEIAREEPEIRVVHHPHNLGYGAAIRSGIAESRYDWILFTDGDDQFEVVDFRKLMKVSAGYDLVISFRLKKIYSWRRLAISWIYNRAVNFLFGTRFRDVSTALRMVRRDVLEDIELTSSSPFVGAELAVKARLKGYRIGEVGVQTFARLNGPGSATSWRNIFATIREMIQMRNVVFSDTYDLPAERPRATRQTSATADEISARRAPTT